MGRSKKSKKQRCGGRGCKCSLIWRGFCCVLVTIASIMVAYGVGESRHQVNSCWLKSSCLLFGDVSAHITPCRPDSMGALPTGGPTQLCDFNLLSAGIQISVAAILALTVTVKMCCTRRASNSTAFSVLELVFCCVCLTSAFITFIISTAGNASFTNKLFSHWNESYAHFQPAAEEPASPSEVYIFNQPDTSTGHPYHFKQTLMVGMVGSWMGVIGWSVYIIIAAVSCHRWQRPKDAEDKPVGKFTRLRSRIAVQTLL
ncbi:uncharacterized protein LOC135830697 [Sycon ciliatum]|uniref:uncharacterized protein LOC135830697 n=1 Tax=Sycon ciliatum TaxID=27933 RepID=UPI0031F71E22